MSSEAARLTVTTDCHSIDFRARYFRSAAAEPSAAAVGVPVPRISGTDDVLAKLLLARDNGLRQLNLHALERGHAMEPSAPKTEPTSTGTTPVDLANSIMLRCLIGMVLGLGELLLVVSVKLLILALIWWLWS